MLSCSCLHRFLPVFAAVALFGLAHAPRPVRAQTAVLTQNNDNARTGANTAEATLTPTSVNASHFGKLFTITGLNADVNGQALYAPHVVIGGVTHNVLCAYTSNNADHSPCGLSAFDADTGAALWQTTLPNSATYTTPTPVIDQAAGTIYVLTKTDNDNTGATYLRAFDLATGAEKSGSPIQIQASAAGTGDGSVNGRVFFDGPASSGRFHANDRPALLLLNGVVYTAFAHNSDSFPYHGWIIGYRYDGTRFTQTAVFCTTPNGGDGGIWQAGKGLTADASGYLYCSVGNGTFDANVGGPDYGMCYLKLRASDLTVIDWFAPYDEQIQSDQDLDLGNSGLVGIPGTTRLFGGATKFGTGFLLDSNNLGGFTPNGPDKALARLDGITGNDSVGQNPIAWDAGAVKYVYLWASGSELEQFRYDPAVGTFSPSRVFKQTSGLTSGGSLAVSAAGRGGGILWAVGNDGVVRAFDAADVSKPPLWTSALNSTRDSLASVGHFQFPTVVNGKVYVPTGSQTIVVYGLLTAPAAHTHVLWTNADGRLSLWNYSPSDGTFTQNTYGPYTNWTAASIADGPDGKTRVLWDNTDGRMSLWSLDNTTGSFTQFSFGPYPGWTARMVSVAPDNTTHVLWINTDSRLSLWNYSTTSGTFTQNTYGPYPGWTATSIADGPDGKARVLWDNTNGMASIWSLDNAAGQFTQFSFGPYTNWMAKSVSVAPDNTTHVLWNNSDGRMSLWNYDTAAGTFTQNSYGPYSGWTAASIADGPDGKTRVLWANTDGTASIWSLDNGVGAFTQFSFGPYPGWTPTAISAGP